MEKLVGIDYSYSCPAVSLYECALHDPFDLDKVKHLVVFRKANKEKYKRDEFVEIPDLKFDLIKFNFLARLTSEFLQPFQTNTYVAIEDYSFSSKGGRNFTIGENCGILKAKLWNDGARIRLYSPMLIKRFAKECNEELAIEFSDGKLKKDGSAKIGALKKSAMHEILCWKFNVDLSDKYKLKKYKSPLADIVDSLWILYILWMEMKVRAGILNNLSEHEINFITDGVKGCGLDKNPFIY